MVAVVHLIKSTQLLQGLTSTKVVSIKMASCFWLTFAVLFLRLSCRVGHARDNSTSSSKDKSGTDINITSLNPTNTSANCALQKNVSAIEDIVRFMYSYTTRVVEIKVLIRSGNETRNLPELVWPWANEIGRTIISLIERSNFFLGETTSAKAFLKVGFQQLDVVFSEEDYRCLPNGSKGSELVFDFLLHQLSHSDDIHDYKLCRAFMTSETESKRYNCCAITGSGNLTICAEYSSITVKTGEIVIFIFTLLLVFFGLPLVIYYLRGFPDECKNYSIADSPLALSAIFHTLFIDGHGPVKSVLRRFIFWLTIAGIFSGISSHFIIVVIGYISIIPFTSLDIFSISKPGQTGLYNAYIRSLTMPWNVKFWWNIFESKLAACQTRCAKFRCVLFSVLVFPFALAYVVLGNVCTWMYVVINYATSLSIMRQSFKYYQLLVVLLQYLALFALVYFITTFMTFTVLLIVAVYLNAEYYGPIVLPVTGLLVYCFRYWRLFVESKYLALKTNIYEVCRELKEDDIRDQNPPADQNTFTVNVTTNEIPKVFYHAIRQKILPYDRILFYFFVKMILVGIFFLLLYSMMVLAQKSNISGPAQIISSLILSTLPFKFDTALAEGTSEQKEANSKDQRNKIRQMIALQRIDNNEIVVSILDEEEEFTINNWTDFAKTVNPLAIWKI